MSSVTLKVTKKKKGSFKIPFLSKWCAKFDQEEQQPDYKKANRSDVHLYFSSFLFFSSNTRLT